MPTADAWRLESEMSVIFDPCRYHAYLLRFWNERDRIADGRVWRFSLEDPHTGERRGFAELGALVAWLWDEMTGGSAGPLPAEGRRFSPGQDTERGSDLMNIAMKTVKDILQVKGHQVWSVTPDTTVYEALELMSDKGIGAVVVLEDDRLVGVMSERDYARKVILLGRASKDIPVRLIMSEKVITVSSGIAVDECMALMTFKRIRHLPVVDQGKLVGLVSIGDVVKAIISEQQFVIEHYRNMWEYAQE